VKIRSLGSRTTHLRGLLFLAILLVAAFPSPAQRVGSFVSGTTRAANSRVLQILLGPDMTDATEAARALGVRSDPYVGDILAGLFSRMSGSESYRYGLLFREVIEYVLLLPSPSPTKIAANAGELSQILLQLQSIEDAATKAALLRTTPYLPEAASQKPLLDEGLFIEGYLKRHGGGLDPGRLDEALSFIDGCAAHSNTVLRAEVVRAVELARNTEFVRAARGYLARSE